MAEDPDEGGADGARQDAGLTSVAAHGLLNSLGVAKATVSTLRLHWQRLDAATCERLLSKAEDQLSFLADSLADLVRGIPADTRLFLDALDRREGGVPGVGGDDEGASAQVAGASADPGD